MQYFLSLPQSYKTNLLVQDMDKERCGTLPRISVERALCTRNLLDLVSARERDLIYKCFGYRRGCGDEVTAIF